MHPASRGADMKHNWRIWGPAGTTPQTQRTGVARGDIQRCSRAWLTRGASRHSKTSEPILLKSTAVAAPPRTPAGPAMYSPRTPAAALPAFSVPAQTSFCTLLSFADTSSNPPVSLPRDSGSVPVAMSAVEFKLCCHSCRASRKAAISSSLRTSRTPSTSAGWLHVRPAIVGTRASSVNRSADASTSASSPCSDTIKSRS